MQIEIYADILFLINFLMNFFIFYCVNKVNKPKVKLSKIVIISAISSFLYCLVFIFVKYSKIINLFFSLIILILSIQLCFKPASIKLFIRILVMSNIFGIFVGGLAIYIFYLKSSILKAFNLYNFPFKILLISTIISYILIKYLSILYNKIIIKKQTFYTIKIHNNKKSVLVKALLDTGNSLKEPLSQKNILIVEFLVIKNILPENLISIFLENKENDLINFVDKLKNIDFRLIPFKSLGKKNGLMLGIRVDKAEVYCDTKVVLNNVIVGICNFSLSNDNFYNAILSPEMITNI